MLPNACLLVPSPSPHPFLQIQGRPRRNRGPIQGVFAPGWAPGTASPARNGADEPQAAPAAPNVSARDSADNGEDAPQDAPAARNVSARDSDEGEDDEDSGNEPCGVGGGEVDAASVGDKALAEGSVKTAGIHIKSVRKMEGTPVRKKGWTRMAI